MPEKILIVEDSEELRMLLADRLAIAGYVVLQAEDGLQGFEMIVSEKPDLVVLDLMMPAMTGEQVWRKMKNTPEVQNTPFIILTAKRQYQDRYFGKSVSHEDYISKPYDPERLIKRIKEKLASTAKPS